MAPRLPGFRRHSTTVNDPRTGLSRTAVMASAVLIRQSQLRAVHTADWQREAWEFFDVVPELHQAALWWSNCLSRVRLFVAVDDDDLDCMPITVEDQALQRPLNEFFGGQVGQAEMLRRIAIHLQIPGESYLIGADVPDGERIWHAASTAEIESTSSTTYLLTGGTGTNGDKLRLDPQQSMIMRLWLPHAYQAWAADSPAKSLRGTLRELQGLSVRLSADIDSRLAGAGILFIPESATIPAPAATDGANALHEDPFIDQLIRAMVQPITDRDSAAAVVPMVVRVPDAAIEAVKHITFSTPLDDKLTLLRDAATRRLAIGVDMPPEALLGLGTTNHWTAWQIDDDAIKLHIEPTMTLICEAITTQYYRPILARDNMVPNPAKYRVWFTTDELSAPANRGPQAQELYGLGVLSAEAVRRENGFPGEDAPSPAEATANLAIALAKANPELAARLFDAIVATNGLTNPAITVTSNPEAQLPPGSTPLPATPTIGGPPQPGPPPGVPNAGVSPTAAASERDGWLAAVEIGAIRALEMAGKRLLGGSRRNLRHQFEDVPAWRLHEHIPTDHVDHLLDGAYATLTAVLPDQPCVVRAVDHYVRRIIRSRTPHQRAALAQELARIGCVPGNGKRAA